MVGVTTGHCQALIIIIYYYQLLFAKQRVLDDIIVT